MIALMSSYVPESLGYTLRSISFTPGEFFQVDSLYVSGDPVPNVALAAADYNQDIVGAVMGNK